jgi:hypothetical protein
MALQNIVSVCCSLCMATEVKLNYPAHRPIFKINYKKCPKSQFGFQIMGKLSIFFSWAKFHTYHTVDALVLLLLLSYEFLAS